MDNRLDFKKEKTLLDVIAAFSDGNPGAVQVLTTQYLDYPKIDPQAALGGLHVFMFLDSMRLYGPSIWRLWKDVCNQRSRKFALVMRGWQLGLLTKDTIVRSANGQADLINWKKLDEDVMSELTLFQPPMSGNGEH